MSDSVATWGPSGRLVAGGVSKSLSRHLQDTVEGIAAGNVPVAASGVVTAADAEKGIVSRSLQTRSMEVLRLTDFTATADGDNRSQAFQRAYNEVYRLGGGVLEVPYGTYVKDRYLLSDIGGQILWNTGLTSISGYAHHTQIPSNIIVRGIGNPTLQFPRNVSSSGGNYVDDRPYGYGGSWQMLTASAGPDAEYTTYTATAVVRDSTGHGVSLTDITGLAVGQVVMVEGSATTPSQENSPLQFMTISSISSLTIYFCEKFLHYFESVVATLTVKKCTRAGGWTSNIQFENLTFEGTDASRESYFLVSRTNGARFYNVNLKRFHINPGRSENFHMKGFKCSDGGKVYVEATSKYTLDEFDIDASNLLNAASLGGIYVNDNAKRGVIKNGTISGGKRNGMSLLWGVECVVKNVDLIDCASDSTASVTFADEDAALRLGHSMTAAVHSTRASASGAAYKTMQTPNSKVVLENVNFPGQTKRAIVAGNTKLDIVGRMYIGHTGSGASPIEIGQTGTKTADATFFPAGGVGSLRLLGDIDIVTDQAATLIPIRATYGGRGYLRAPDTTLSSGISVSDTSVPVADGSRCSTSLRLGPQIDHPTNFAPFTITISSISGNTLTTSAISTAAASGSGLYYYEDEALLAKCDIEGGRIFVNGVRSKMPRAGWQTKYPTTATGGGPYTGSFDISVPGEGEWELTLIYLSQDKGHRVRSRYIVNYSNEYAAFPANVISSALDTLTLRTAVAFGVHTIAAGVVTVNLSNTTSGKGGVVYYRWRPIASMQVTLGVS